MQNSRRNFILLFVELVTSSTFETLLGTTTVLPALVGLLGGGPVIVGAMAAIQSGSMFLPQFLAGRHMAGRPHVKRFLMAPLTASRVAWLLFLPVLWLCGRTAPSLALGALLVTMAIYSAGIGFAGVPWMEMWARAIPAERRGRAYGSAQSVAGVVCIGAGAAATAILARPQPFPENHLLLLGLATLLSLPTIPLLGAVAESEGPARAEPGIPWRAYLPRLGRILRRDRALTWLIALRWLGGLADAAAAFYVVYATRRLGLPAQVIGLFISANVAGNLLSGVLFGALGDRCGRVPVIRSIMALRCLSPALALLAPLAGGLHPWLAPALFILTFTLMGLVSGGFTVGFVNCLFELAPADERMLYISFFNTLGGALLAAPLLAGWLVQATSYEALFAVCLAFGALGLLAALRVPATAPGRLPRPAAG